MISANGIDVGNQPPVRFKYYTHALHEISPTVARARRHARHAHRRFDGDATTTRRRFGGRAVPGVAGTLDTTRARGVALTPPLWNATEERPPQSSPRRRRVTRATTPTTAPSAASLRVAGRVRWVRLRGRLPRRHRLRDRARRVAAAPSSPPPAPRCAPWPTPRRRPTTARPSSGSGGPVAGSSASGDLALSTPLSVAPDWAGVETAHDDAAARSIELSSFSSSRQGSRRRQPSFRRRRSSTSSFPPRSMTTACVSTPSDA